MTVIRETLAGVELELETSAGLFSPRSIDRGTRAMLSVVRFRPDDHVLDLGCGYGVVGILAARLIGPERVVLLDNDAAAVRLSRRNAERNGVGDVTVEQSDAFRDSRRTGYTLILSNPPYHVDFSVPKEFIQKGFNRLALGGRMVLVTRRRRWYERKLTSIFGGVDVQEVDGYSVLASQKRRADYASAQKR